MLLALASTVSAGPMRKWCFISGQEPVEAELLSIQKGMVTLKAAGNRMREFSFDKFSPEDQVYLFRTADEDGRPFAFPAEPGPQTGKGYASQTVPALGDRPLTLTGASELHVTDKSAAGRGTVNFGSPDAWLVFDNTPASKVIDGAVKSMKVYGAPAVVGQNVRVTAYGNGSVVIPQGPDYPALTAFTSKGLSGPAIPLQSYVNYDVLKLGVLTSNFGSFRLKRGYMATIASNADGSGVSRNYVAQDHDVEVSSLPAGLENSLKFVRIFPWRWTSKKGVAGGIWQDLNLGWFYDWNISTNSTPDLEYVPIRQKRWWPGLNQDWKARGSLHLLGYNEPDRPDQAKLTVDEAIASWPELMATGLRLGAPAPSDGGLNWLYQFIDKADQKGLRVDFVPVHYYRAVADPNDPRAAAEQFRAFLDGIHKRVKRPLWITEWNNGANWTTAPDPNPKQQAAAVEKMIEMLDQTPYVERYAIYNWVEAVREVKAKDGTLSPAGIVYRDKVSPLAYSQQRPEK
ncbi:hypothetical protein llg_42030 [Luteolibacter sp. LG18]|nr:hypothetical protein llg_42030 [Luteolibacter sp. LG18]